MRILLLLKIQPPQKQRRYPSVSPLFLWSQIDDSIISNNHDIVKLIGTIAKIVYDFSKAFPLSRIEINPIDEKRKRLYHHVFRRNFDIINADFQVKGVYKGIDEEEDYSPEKIYDFFRLKRKFVQ